MRCGLDGTDCALEHVLPTLGGQCTKRRVVGSRTTPYEWAATCPLCGGVDKLTLTAKGRTILRHCQRCKASQDDLTAALAKLLPACFGVRAQRRPIDGISKDDLISVLQRDLNPAALGIELLRTAGVGAAEARRILKMPKSTYYRALGELGSSPTDGTVPSPSDGTAA